jgi:hypothetical protein
MDSFCTEFYSMGINTTEHTAKFTVPGLFYTPTIFMKLVMFSGAAWRFTTSDFIKLCRNIEITNENALRTLLSM